MSVTEMNNDQISDIKLDKPNRNKFKKRFIIIIVILILLSPLIYGFVGEIIINIQIQNAHQGELIYYVMHSDDIIDNDLLDFVLKNHKTKGIHVAKTKSNKEKYILLATGEQPIQGINIAVESVVGYKDKILINGKVLPPKSEIVATPSYPHLLIRIESENDPREVQLGTMNLYDVFRGIQEPIRISLDNAILKELDGNVIKLVTFKQAINQTQFVLTDGAKKEIEVQGIKAGDLISVKLNTDISQEYPKVEHIRKTTNVTEKIEIVSISKDTQVVTAKVNNIPVTLKYRSEMQDKINRATTDTTYLVRLEKVGDVIYITEIIGL